MVGDFEASYEYQPVTRYSTALRKTWQMSFIHRLHLDKVLRQVPLRSLLNAAADRRLQNAVNIEDLRRCASLRSHPMVFSYLDSGADDQIVKERNSSAYADYEMVSAPSGAFQWMQALLLGTRFPWGEGGRE